ncbi:mCG1038614, partial [Mus musculus]
FSFWTPNTSAELQRLQRHTEGKGKPLSSICVTVTLGRRGRSTHSALTGKKKVRFRGRRKKL